MADLARIAPSLALRPWQQRPDEPPEDWQAFLMWLHTHPRPNPIPEGAREAAVRWNWLQRAAMHEHALAPREDPRVQAERIARNALGIMDREMAWQFAQSDSQPGLMSNSDLMKLFTVVLQFESRISPVQDEGRTQVDMSDFTPDEAAQYAYLRAKAHRPAKGK